MANRSLAGRSSEPFAEVFEREFAAIHRYVRRRVGIEAADDIASETFTIAYRQWDRFDSDRPVRPWLYGIATNLARRHRRSERRQLRAYARSGVDPVTASGEGEAIQRLDAEGVGRKLASAVADLRSAERDVLLLHAWADLSDSEIATALGLPIGTVKSRLHRARDRIRNSIDPIGQEDDVRALAPAEDTR